jgi:hypothetical protein
MAVPSGTPLANLVCVSELTREDHWCRMGLLAGAAIHWVVAALMAWDEWFRPASETSIPESGWRLAALAATLLGVA